MDYPIPLVVDTNVVYQIDEASFPGLQEGSHSFEPSLIIDFGTGIPLDSNDADPEMTDTLTTSCDVKNQDLYNLIDSLNVELMLFPTDSANILDLPGIQLDHRNNNIADSTDVNTAANEFSVDELTAQVNFEPEEYVDSLEINQEKVLEESQTNDDILSTTSKTHHRISSCLFTSTRRKRRFPSADDTVNTYQTEVPAFTKRRKLDLNELCWNTDSIKSYFDKVIDGNLSEISFFSEFCESPVKRLYVRQC